MELSALIDRAKELKDKQVYIQDIGDPNVPFILGPNETFGTLTSFDASKIHIAWDVNVPGKFGCRASIVLPINVVKNLILKEEWESSPQFLELANTPFKFELGQLCYLSSKANGSSSESNPKIGSDYERHGKVLSIISNRNNTFVMYKVRWFLSREGWFPENVLLSVQERTEIVLKRQQQFVLVKPDPLVTDGTSFLREGDYFKALDDSAMISTKYKNLFKPK